MPWVVTGEIYPTATRGKQMSLSTASNWLFNFGIGYATPYLVNTGAGNAGLQTNVFCAFRLCLVFETRFAHLLVRLQGSGVVFLSSPSSSSTSCASPSPPLSFLRRVF
jgi:hypothetical protein